MPTLRKILKTIAVTLGILFFVFVILALRPIYDLQESDCKTVSGTVDELWGHKSSADINIRIGDGRHYYINRGMEAGLDPLQLRDQLLHREVSISYADHWTPLDPRGIVRHVARVTLDGEVLYNEISD